MVGSAPPQNTQTNPLPPAVSPAYMSRGGQVTHTHQQQPDTVRRPALAVLETRLAAYTCFRALIAQIYALCGGTRLLTDDLDDLEHACAHIAREAQVPWPDRRQALGGMVASMLRTLAGACLTVMGGPGSYTPVGVLEQLLARRDHYEIHRRAADPEQILDALEVRRSGTFGELRARLAEQIHARDRRYVDRVIRPVLHGGGPGWKTRAEQDRYADRAVALTAFVGPAPFVALGFPAYGLGAGTKAHGEALEDAGHAELAALARYIAADLRSEHPRLRVEIRCPVCDAQTLWIPRQGVAPHGHETRPGPCDGRSQQRAELAEVTS